VSTKRWQGEVLLFDLFGTVVQFTPQVPTVEVAGTRWRSAMGWLRDAAARELPGVLFDDVLAAIAHVTQEIVRLRVPEYHEVPSRERFRRALHRLGVEEPHEMAERLSVAHMRNLASMTALPAGHADLLAELATRYRLALVSNFDHASTARRVLAMHDVARFFEMVLISDDHGRRKPHPAIFEAALRGMRVEASHALFIGDSLDEDVGGAQNVGLTTVWINAKGEAPSADAPLPDYTIARLTELRSIVE